MQVYNMKGLVSSVLFYVIPLKYLCKCLVTEGLF